MSGSESTFSAVRLIKRSLPNDSVKLNGDKWQREWKRIAEDWQLDCLGVYKQVQGLTLLVVNADSNQGF